MVAKILCVVVAQEKTASGRWESESPYDRAPEPGLKPGALISETVGSGGSIA